MRSLAEWVLSLSVVGGLIWLALPVVRGLAPLPGGTILVESALPALPPGVPAGADSVSFLILDGDRVIRLGMDEHALRTGSYQLYTAGPAASEPGVLGERTVLPFRAGPSRFWVVLDRTGPDRDREVTAIYIR
jgi:hypothetical protein